MYLIQVLLFLLLGVSLCVLVFNGSKFRMSDAVTPANAKMVVRSIKISGVVIFFSVLTLIMIWMMR